MTKKINAFIVAVLLMAGQMVVAQEYIVPVEQWDCEEVNGSNYHGYSFNESWEVDFRVENQDGRYSLTPEDIVLVEALVQKRLAYLNREHENQGGMCPVVDEHIRKYRRQYVGFTDADGFRIAWVNFLWDDNITDEQLAQDIIFTSGGCGHYWHLKVNLDTEKLYGLEVNEEGEVKYLPRAKKRAPRISRPKRMGDDGRIRKTGIIHTEEEKQF